MTRVLEAATETTLSPEEAKAFEDWETRWFFENHPEFVPEVINEIRARITEDNNE